MLVVSIWNLNAIQSKGQLDNFPHRTSLHKGKPKTFICDRFTAKRHRYRLGRWQRHKWNIAKSTFPHLAKKVKRSHPWLHVKGSSARNPEPGFDGTSTDGKKRWLVSPGVRAARWPPWKNGEIISLDERANKITVSSWRLMLSIRIRLGFVLLLLGAPRGPSRGW